MTAPNRYLRGSTQQCPKCGSRKVAYDPELGSAEYGPGLAVCQNCKTLWEAFEPSQIWDRTDPHCSFREPCNNCAFRPGSNEQQDHKKWRTLIDALKVGAKFYCHKGLPITPDAEHGFAYPTKTVSLKVDGKAFNKEVENPNKMRLCRGFLNAMIKLHRAGKREIKSGKLDALAIGGYPPEAVEP